MQWSSRLSSVCLSSPRQISKTMRDRRAISSVRFTKQEYNVTFWYGEKKGEKKYERV